MQVFRSLDEVPAQFGPTVLSVGNFDGVHRAHQQVVSHMAERAHAIGGQAVVVTFEPHPLRILRPDVAPKLLAPLPVKLKLLEQTRVDAVLVLPFTRDLSMMSAHDFAKIVLAETLHAREVHEGYNFHFGHKAQGNVNTLGALGEELGQRLHLRHLGHEPLWPRLLPASAARRSPLRVVHAVGDDAGGRGGPPRSAVRAGQQHEIGAEQVDDRPWTEPEVRSAASGHGDLLVLPGDVGIRAAVVDDGT